MGHVHATSLLVFAFACAVAEGEDFKVGAVVAPVSPSVTVDRGGILRRTAADNDWPRLVTDVNDETLQLDLPIILDKTDALPIYSAIRHYDTKLSELGDQPAAADWLKLRADCFLHLEFYDSAADDYLVLRKLRPDHEWYMTKAACACQLARRYETALQICDELLARNSDLAAAHYWRGRALSGKDDFTGAILAFDRAIELDPKDADSYVRRSSMHIVKRDYDKAIRDSLTAVELEPSVWNFFIAIGCYLAREEVSAAIDLLRKGLEFHPDNEALLLAYAMMMIATDQEESIEGKYRSKTPVADWICFVQASRALAERRFDDAVAGLSAGISRDSSFKPMLLMQRAQVYLERGDRDLARGEIDAIIDNYPQSAEALQVRGLFALKIGDLAGAEADFSAAVAAELDSSTVYLGLADIQKARGNFDEARGWLAKAEQKEPEDAAVRLAAARLELVAGRPDAAIQKCNLALAAAELTERNDLQIVKLTDGGFQIQALGFSSVSPKCKCYKSTIRALTCRGYAQARRGNYAAALSDIWRVCTLPVVSK